MLKKICQRDIYPKGWLKKQLELQSEGLSGNIGKVFDDLSENSAWLGGTGEAWERGPYYLDGLVPLAFILKDEKLIEKAKVWVDGILGTENDVFGFGSLRTNDYWPRMAATKALISYYRATGDERIIPFLLKYFRFVYENIEETGLFYWAAARAIEAFEAIVEVYEITGEKFLPLLCEKLLQSGYDWKGYYENFPYDKPMTAYTNRTIFRFIKNAGEPFVERLKKKLRHKQPHKKDKVTAFNNNSITKLIMLTHGVNIAMAYKYPVYQAIIEGEKDLSSLALKGYRSAMERHGLSIGLTSGDEHIMGTDASGGVELCSVMEQAYSFEECLRLTGNMQFAELLEYIVFNAMPATFTEDMTAHQYVQQPNQIAADRKHRQFFNVNKEANIFGVAPNFGCCAANMHQGFPKYADNLVYLAGKSLHFYAYAPFTLKTVVGGQKVEITQSANYPFENFIRFEVAVGENLSLNFRKPNFAEKALFNGKEYQAEGEIYSLTASKGDVFEIRLRTALTIQKNFDGSVSTRRNNLLFALPLAAKERYVRGEKPFHYREFVTEDEFAFGLYLNENGILAEESGITKGSDLNEANGWFSKGNAPLEFTVKGFSVGNWSKRKHSAKSPPKEVRKGEDVAVKLVPYGCTLLRIAQFPFLKKQGRYKGQI